MLVVTLQNLRQRVRCPHERGPLVLGRRPEVGPAHLTVDDPAVSPNHLRIEALSDTVLRVDNLADAPLALPGGETLASGGTARLALPVRLDLGHTQVEVVGASDGAPESPHASDESSEAPPADHRYQTVAAPALSPLRLAQPAAEPTATAPKTLASLGKAPSVEKLAEWFETLLSVQRSVAGSSEFYRETARALVDLVGLDRGLVLLREGTGWNQVAGHTADPRRGLAYSSTIVDMVAQQARTFYGNPQGLSLRTSLANVEALVASPVLDDSGAVVGILYGSRDVTLSAPLAEIQPLEAQVVQMLASSVSAGLIRVRMEERLRQVEQLAAVGQAIGYIVHDLRGPLGNAQMLIAMLRGETASWLTREQQLDVIETSLGICRELLDDSLEFCRGRVRVAPVRGTFRELFARHLQLLRMDLEALQVAFTVNVPDDLVVVLDPDRMARVLRNLAKNAAEACRSRDNARVTLGARATAEGCELWVEDNGPGLPPQVQAKLFQPFGTHGKRGGTGFGLAIARQLVEAHQGRIDVSTGPRGTRFTLTLPGELPGVAPQAAGGGDSATTTPDDKSAAEAAHSDAPTDTPLGPIVRPLRVLLAEDGLVNQRLVAAMLQRGNHLVTVAANGREALAALEAASYDIVLMDQEMPEINGMEATAAIRERERRSGAHIPIVAMTAHAMPGDERRFLEAGMDGYLCKPIRPAELNRVLAERCTTGRAVPAQPAGAALPLESTAATTPSGT